MTDPSPRTRGPKRTPVAKDALLDAAQAVFGREGVEGASIRAIAREAGCDPSLIYYHFESKDAVFTALLERTFPALREGVAALADPGDGRPASERLWAVIQLYHEALAADAGFRDLIRGAILRGAEGVRSAIAERVIPVVGTIGRIVSQGVARGEIRPDTPPMLVAFFLVRLEIEILDLLPVMGPLVFGGDGAGLTNLAEAAWFRLFWRGIALRPDEPLAFLPSAPSLPL